MPQHHERKAPGATAGPRRLRAGLHALLLPALLLSLVALLSACGGGGGGPEPTGETAATALPTRPAGASELRAAVPRRWSLAESATSTDGTYVALVGTGRASGSRDPINVLAVYARIDGVLTEVARIASCCGPDQPAAADLTLHEAEHVLDPDDAGVRTISAGPVTVTIDAAGAVTVTNQSSAGPPAQGSVPADPAGVISVTPPSQVPATPQPALSVPAGAVPVGWSVEQAVWSPDREQVAVTTSLAGSMTRQLSVYSLAEGDLRELWRELNFFVSFDSDIGFRDINGDGDADLVYVTSDGGNAWTGSPTQVLTVDERGDVRDVRFRLPARTSAARQAVDIDNDGVYEFVAIDASWELQGFCHACSPASEFILAWDGRQYADATPRFAAALDLRRMVLYGHLDPEPLPSSATCADVDAYLADAISRYLDYWNSGRQDDAARILDNIRALQPPTELAAKRDWIVDTLARDPHAAKVPSDLVTDCPFS